MPHGNKIIDLKIVPAKQMLITMCLFSHIHISLCNIIVYFIYKYTQYKSQYHILYLKWKIHFEYSMGAKEIGGEKEVRLTCDNKHTTDASKTVPNSFSNIQ